MPTRVLIVDDHPLMCEALSEALTMAQDADFEVQATRTLADGLARLAEHGCDVVLLDLGLPGCSGLDALHAVRRVDAEVAVAIVSSASDRRTIIGCLQAGANGFVPKTAAREVMINALRLILSGGTYVPPEAVIGERADRMPSAADAGAAWAPAPARPAASSVAPMAPASLPFLADSPFLAGAPPAAAASCAGAALLPAAEAAFAAGSLVAAAMPLAAGASRAAGSPFAASPFPAAAGYAEAPPRSAAPYAVSPEFVASAAAGSARTGAPPLHLAAMQTIPGRPNAERPRVDPRQLGLTQRQIDVLGLMLNGLPNKLICRRLKLAEGTVKVHVSAVLRALGVHSRTQAVVAAGRMGLRVDEHKPH